MTTFVARETGAEDNPYLLGVHAPVRDEITAGDLEVIGQIPRDLNGVYLRNGPNRRYDAPGRYHWFDGDGMVHAMAFEDGTARYRNRYVRTAALTAEEAAGRALWSGVMESPRGNPVGTARGLPFKDSANTDLVHHDGRVLATWYLCGQPMSLDPLSLETIGAETFLGTLRGDVMAHPKSDEATGELMWFDYGARDPLLRYGVVGASGRIEHEITIDLPGPRLPHDMAITENFSVLMDLPLTQDAAAAREGRYKIAFDRETPARFAVVPRRGTEVRWFTAEPCYIYHVVNAFEDGATIVMDVCRVTRPAPVPTRPGPLGKLLGYLRLDARLHRYVLDLTTGTTTETQLDDANTEFPSIDARLTGRAARYAYSVHIADTETVLFDGLLRHDRVTGERQEHRFGPGRYGSEAPFAPRDGSTGEDDGYLVSFVTDERTGRSEVEVLDASDLTAGPVARVLLPRRVPVGFHATWVRADQLRAPS
ncbi:carotenoid oxygenase family protein [Pseudonocardia sp. KRD-184]|uniref:Dioxygenase n=1 Tax=Pseudonocardia oceani TaxID=2792013 RepID=A0ABS6U7J0_9PSEU|nr:carotenoid oxygenase family protein [Pseudonocardia oceani]MBW0088468.1 carotenoid oxygenase family protein [Pseudonocardia oceani]MBW0095182.1 carotenoid oxygenase family protein [Pseudonocardia oceani]MBW0108028.1 carotenoid oxygenase family protein [Pseudonocardia oceani]MBW0120732.1 carotenoid oxygenase family protein [Pseudonocardia oceani]MBW0127874.1 carotenoid oxygenase family protein [Pseudonocardia oceani]